MAEVEEEIIKESEYLNINRIYGGGTLRDIFVMGTW